MPRNDYMPIEDRELSHSSPIEILLVDDHPQVRKLLREVIETYDVLRIVGEAINGEEAVLFAAKLKPAAVVMDVHLPVLNGVPATALIKRNNPLTAIVGLTAGDPHEDAKAMTLAGAAVVINKSDAFHVLYPAILNAIKQIKYPV